MKRDRIGPYAVNEMIGKGGMGEVYRARDERLERDVALKVLPRELASDPDRLARFEREAKVLASLQHQSIAAIYGLESPDEGPVLVLELAEGEDLTNRIESGPMPSDEVRRIARQLALGLEYAHEQGIVHRDLKPANIKLAEDGQIKILDFGLARAFTLEGNGSGAGGSWQPTVTQGLTVAGSVIGTAAYMSPEQARGYDVDRRSDIWAFGVILFEMLTGRRLFRGETATDTLAAVMRKEPEWDLLPDDAPLLTQLCHRCLERDPQLRLRDIGEARIALEGPDTSVLGLSIDGTLASVVKPPVRFGRLPWVLAGALFLVAAAIGYLGWTDRLGPRPDSDPVVHSSIRLPENMRLGLNPASPGPVQVSPDGSRLVFASVDTLGQVQLQLRELDQPVARPLAGTASAGYPFWSPDGRSIAFYTREGLLRRLDISGGPVLTVIPAENGKGGSWNRFDEILYAPSHIASIHLVAATGGESRAVTDLAGDDRARSHRFPQWLPDGEHFIYLSVQRGSDAADTDSILRLGSKDGSVDRELMPCQVSGQYSLGHILFVHDGALMARPFSLEILDFTGPAFPVCDEVLAIRAAHCSIFSASENGVLVYTTGESGDTGVSILEVIDPEGNPVRGVGEPLMVRGVRFDPAGEFVAISRPDLQVGTFDIWLHELDRDLSTRLTFDSESEETPTWSPDGNWIYYASDRSGRSNIYRHRVSGAGRPELLFASPLECYPTSISRDGKTLCYTTADSTGDFDLWLCDLEGEPQPRGFRETDMFEMRGEFSPDGRWLAYASFETGSMEIFVESLDPSGGRYRVSSQGGALARWSPGGDRLYYVTMNNELMAVDVAADGDGMRFGKMTRIAEGVELNGNSTLDVDSASGNLLIQRPALTRQRNTLALITGWPRLLERNRER